MDYQRVSTILLAINQDIATVISQPLTEEERARRANEHKQQTKRRENLMVVLRQMTKQGGTTESDVVANQIRELDHQIKFLPMENVRRLTDDSAAVESVSNNIRELFDIFYEVDVSGYPDNILNEVIAELTPEFDVFNPVDLEKIGPVHSALAILKFMATKSKIPDAVWAPLWNSNDGKYVDKFYRLILPS